MMRGLYIVFVVFFSSSLIGQSGVNIRVGVGSLISNSDNLTVEGQAHYGLRVGAFARIGAGSDSWYLNPGLFYERYHVLSNEGFDAFESKDDLHFAKLYVDLGLFLIRSKIFKLRLQGGGTLNYLAEIDNRKANYGLDYFNDAAFGVNLGLGVDIFFLTLDFGYERGVSQFIREEDGTRSDYYNASLGFFF